MNDNIIPFDVKNAFAEADKYFPHQIQKFQYYDKYARFNYDLGRRETWIETVDRAVSYLRELSEEKLPQVDYDRIRLAMLNMSASPSMRLLAMAGDAARRQNIAIYNCSYLPIDSIDSLVEELIIAMAGCGVGFSVERQYVEKFPKIEFQRNSEETFHTIDDSTEGWAEAFRLGLTEWFDGQDVVFDYSQIREAGTPLKIKGGRASGPKPFEDLLNFTRKTILARQGKKLRPIDAHRIACKVGECIVSGGVRRTALISLFDQDDEEMRNCKNGEVIDPELWMANNSAVWTDDVSEEKIHSQMQEMHEGQRGEPGIFSRYNANKLKPTRRKEADYGTNPCFAADTIIETIHGQKMIYEITEPTWVYSMDENQKLVLKRATASWISKRNAQTLKITVANGKSLTITPDHKIWIEGKGWVEAKDIKVKDRVVALLRQRRGAKYSGIKLTTEKAWQMEHRFIWEGKNGKIPEGYDINHKDMETYHNDINNFELLTHKEHATLTRNATANNHQIKDPKTGRWVSGENSKHGAKVIVDMPEYLKSGFHQYATVTKIEEGRTADVYDIGVEDTHNVIANGIVAHNCGEINLRPYEFCNLSIAIARKNDTEESLREKVEIATIIGTIQSMGTNFPGLRDIWKQNCQEERLLGVDINGWRDADILDASNVNLPFLLEDLKSHAIEINKKYAQILGIPQSASVTCVKPSGNSGVLFNCASGLHARWASYYIRRVRVQAQSPLARIMQEQGVPIVPELGQDWSNASTYVASFPLKSSEGSLTKNSISAIEQCEYWLLSKKHWTEHNPSVTITYESEEFDELVKWVIKHKKWIGGMSFLPASNAKYDLMPNEEITQEQYEKMIENFPSLDFSHLWLYEQEDMTDASAELACVSGTCSLDEYKALQAAKEAGFLTT